jgi:glyoxylase-like metal-dependent hydrolase (beta-lactamase superfamily II)
MGKDERTFVHQFLVGPWDNFVYFVGDLSTRSCMVVDPAWELSVIEDEAAKLDVSIGGILCTHSHFDHVNMVHPLVDKLDIPVYMLDKEVTWSNYRSQNLNRVKSGDTVKFGKALEVTFLHTPGHTPGSACFQVDDSLVCGDTLFINGCGRCDFLGGDPEAMYYSLKALREKLGPQTNMYPGHNYGPVTVATLDEQLKSNAFLQIPTLDDFVKHRMTGRRPNAPFPNIDPDWLKRVEEQQPPLD